MAGRIETITSFVEKVRRPAEESGGGGDSGGLEV